MGIHYLDEYSISHFIAGIILHRMNIPRLLSYGLHILFEIFENYIYVPYFGGRCIRIEYLLPIPDCKTIPDTKKNIIATFSKDDDMINFIHKRQKYKKSDLLLFILEGISAH